MADFVPELHEALTAPVRASTTARAPVELPTLADVPIVILAGGRGTRLLPYTSVLPKPLMPVGDQSILEIVVGQLADCGVRSVHLCVGYLAHLIRAVFDHRAPRDVAITYVYEDDALGTAAPLRLVDGLDRTFIAMNGDVLTTLDYRELVADHREQGNILTIATHNRSIKIDYGMLHLDVAARVQAFEEKPEIVSPVSMGVYVMEPEILAYIPESGRFDIPELVQALLARGEPVGAHRHSGMWFDIGRTDDYEQAVAAWAESGITPAAPHIQGSANGARATNSGALSPLVPRSASRKRASSRRKRAT
jgi:NDP-sugar pyrophosphorylase family protein